MKILVKNYIFNPSTKEITFSDYENIELERILLITNASKNKIIYNFASPLLGGTISGNVLTLASAEVNDTDMDSVDSIQIFYEADIAPATDLAIEENTSVVEALHALLSLLSFLPAVRGSLADLRVTPTGTVSVAGSLTTLTTLTNMAQMGGFPLNTVPKSFDNQLAVLGNINNVSITV